MKGCGIGITGMISGQSYQAGFCRTCGMLISISAQTCLSISLERYGILFTISNCKKFHSSFSSEEFGRYVVKILVALSRFCAHLSRT